MALIGYTITVVAKQDNPYNVLPETDISIRKNSDNTLVNIYADEAGLIPIAQLGAKTDSNGQFTFYADSSLGILKAVWANGGVVATEVLDSNDHSKLANRNAVGAHDASAINTNSGSTVQESLNKNRHSISFVFDDAYESTSTILKPLFDTYNAKFGLAVPVGSLGNPSRLTLEGVREMASLGYEIINHATSGDVMNTTAKGVGGVLGELATNWSMLHNVGIKTTGFQTPSSILNAAYIDIVDTYSDYAFTLANNQSVLPYGTARNKLYRYSVEAATLAECESVMDSLAESDGGIVFYAHDIASGDANYLKLQAILDKSVALGIPVLLPRACIEKSVTPLPNNVKRYIDGGIISNTVQNYTSSGGSSISVAASKDMTVTIPSAGGYLVQRVVNLDDKDDIDDVVNFSALIRDLTVAKVDNCEIAIKFYDAVDAGGSVLYTTDEYDIDLNNSAVRYFAEGVKGLAKSALFYIRLTCNDACSVLVRQPVIRYGTSIKPVKMIDTMPTTYSTVIPTQSITAGAGYQTITLTDAATNGLYTVSSSSVVFQKNATVNIVLSPIANGTNIGVGWLGGSCGITISGVTVGIGPVAGGDNHLAGMSTITLKVYRGYAVSFKALASGIALQIGSANSRLLISEL